MSSTAASQAEFQDGGKPVAGPIYLVDAAGFPVSGVNATPVAASTSTDTIIKGSVGCLCRVLVTTTGSNALNIWDNATGHTGTIIGAVAANAVAGTLVECQAPAINGITVQGNASNPAITVIWS